MTASEVRPFLFSCIVTLGIVSALSSGSLAQDAPSSAATTEASPLATAHGPACEDGLLVLQRSKKDSLVVGVALLEDCSLTQTF